MPAPVLAYGVGSGLFTHMRAVIQQEVKACNGVGSLELLTGNTKEVINHSLGVEDEASGQEGISNTSNSGEAIFTPRVPSMSMWTSCKATADTPPDRDVTMSELVEMVRNPSPLVVGTVTSARAALARDDKLGYKGLKAKLPAFAISGAFSGRANTKLQRHSGLLGFDFDRLSPGEMERAWAALISDPHVLLAFRSPSGEGIKGAISVPVEEDGTGHLEAFLSAENYFRHVHGLTLDPACKDVARLCFFSHDPDVHYNPDARTLDLHEWAPLRETSLTEEEKLAESLDTTLEAVRLTSIKDPPPPPPVVLSNAAGAVIATPGNLVTIEGIQKAGKTGVISAIIGSAIAGTDSDGDFLGIKAAIPEDSFVIHFDCEQSAHAHHRLVTTAVTKRAGLDEIPPQLLTFSLLRPPRAERWALVTRCCQVLADRGGTVGLIVLDGAADFIPGVNDEESSIAFVEALHRLADQMQSVIVLVIHENPGAENGKTRGHLGSELWRKSQGCLGVKKGADGISALWAKFLRDGDWAEKEGSYFRYDINQGMHVACDDPAEERQAERDRKKRQGLDELARAVLSVPLSHTELKAAIMRHERVKESTAKTRIRDMAAATLITQMQGGSYARVN